jgi:hypothetical protein
MAEQPDGTFRNGGERFGSDRIPGPCVFRALREVPEFPVPPGRAAVGEGGYSSAERNGNDLKRYCSFPDEQGSTEATEGNVFIFIVAGTRSALGALAVPTRQS